MSHPFVRPKSARRSFEFTSIVALKCLTYLLLLGGGAIFAHIISKGAPVLWDRGLDYIIAPETPKAMTQFIDASGEERMLDADQMRLYEALIKDEEFQQAFLKPNSPQDPLEIVLQYPAVSKMLGGLTLSRSSVESSIFAATKSALELAEVLENTPSFSANLESATLAKQLRDQSTIFAAVEHSNIQEQFQVIQNQAATFHSLISQLDSTLGSTPENIATARQQALQLQPEVHTIIKELLQANPTDLEESRRLIAETKQIVTQLRVFNEAAVSPYPENLSKSYQEASLAATELQTLSEHFNLDRAINQRIAMVKEVNKLLKQPKMREAIELAISGKGEAKSSDKTTQFSAGSLLGPLVGTILLVTVCVVIALFLGVSAAVYLSEYTSSTSKKPSLLQSLGLTAIITLISLALFRVYAPMTSWTNHLISCAVIAVLLGLSMPFILRNWIHLVRLAIVNLAGVPSIVFGIFGFAFFVIAGPKLTSNPEEGAKILLNLPGDWVVVKGWGTSVLAGAVTLAFMILPVVIVAAEEALRAVPQGFREASLALGASKWETIQKAVLPYATPGILTSSVLAITRVAGETAPIMFTAAVISRDLLPWQDSGGMNASLWNAGGWNPLTWLDQPVMALPYHVYTLAQKLPDTEAGNQAQYGSVLVFVILVFLLAAASILLRMRLRAKIKW